MNKTLNNLSSEKFHYLYSLRGIAALIVVISHTHEAFFKPNQLFNFSSIIDFLFNYTFFVGVFSVKIFFVLSGFVLSYHYFKGFNNNYLIKQSVKRIPRLFIPVLATSILYWILNHYDCFYNQEIVKITNTIFFSRFWVEKYSFFVFLKRCIYDLMIFNDQSFCWNINSALWTMPLELKFSFILFVSIFFIRNYLTLFLYNIIIFTFIYYNEYLFSYAPFVLGINMAFIFTKKTFEINIIQSVCLIIVANFMANNFHLDININFISSIIPVLGALLIILVALFSKNLQNILNQNILIYLGKVSFSLYLIHNLILGTISSYVYLKLFNQFHFSYSLTYAITFIVSLVFSIFAAGITYELIDKQSLKLTNIIYNLFERFILKKIELWTK